MKKSRFSLAVMLCVTMLFSCEENVNEVTGPEVDQIEGPELAFPDQQGESVSIDIGGAVLECEQFGEVTVYEGDIILSPEQLKELKNGRTSAVGLTGRRWPGGVVYYSVSSSLPKQYRVYDAIAHWEANTDVRFVARTNQRNYVDFVRSSGCSSSLGMIGGRQRINLGDGCSTGNTIHEIGHALGLFHEHTRVDRDQTINVNWQNIRSGKEHNFRRADERYSARDYTSTIDFGSIMMYSSYAFSTNGRPTLVRKNGSTWRSQRSGLAASDIEGIQRMYFGTSGGQIITNGYYKVKARHSGLLLQVENSSTANGTNVSQWSDTGGDHQVWYVEYLGNDQYRFMARHSNKVLDVAYSGTEPGTNVHQWSWNGTNAQRWIISPAGNGYYTIQSVTSSLYLDVSGESTANGGNVMTWSGTGRANQEFSFIPGS